MPDSFDLSCPVPFSDSDKILLAHGGGGSMSGRLIRDLFIKTLGNQYLNEEHDGAIFEVNGTRLAFSTDSYVIEPIFFPGGDIGELAVNGTVNDLSCCGARPLFLSLAMIIEEGLPIDQLVRITESIKKAADLAEVLVVTGDTKVVGKGKGDKIFINTSGIGVIPDKVHISPRNAQAGDLIILSGFLGDHGVAIMAARNGLEFETSLKSDTAPLNKVIEEVLSVTTDIHVLRDPTRGGLASTLNEIASSSGIGMDVDETAIPVREEVAGLCEVLGLDPLYIANEGKMVFILPENLAGKVLEVLHKHEATVHATVIGKVVKEHPGVVKLRTAIGTSRILDMISGEQLPRIC